MARSGSPLAVVELAVVFAKIWPNPRAKFWLALALCCLASSIYFALVIAPLGLGRRAPTVQQGLFPEWLGCREILLHGRDPYRPAITEQIQLVIYGNVGRESSEPVNQHRFAYPVFFAFLLFPIALLPFPLAQNVTLAICIVVTALSVPCWLRPARLTDPAVLTCALFAFASYPVVLGLQLRQPTLIIAALLATVFSWVRSGRPVLAGILMALCMSKPQLAIAMLVPLLICALAEWHTRKSFVLALGASAGVLLLLSEFAVEGWVTQWLNTVRAYSHYAGSSPLLVDLLHHHRVLPAGVLLVGSVVWVSCKFHSSDLLFAVGYSSAVFLLLFPFQIYNEVLLLPATLWIVKNASLIEARGQLTNLLYGCSWVVIGMGWATSVGLSMANLIAPGSGQKLWQLPLLAAYLYPFSIWVLLALYGIGNKPPHLPRTP